MKIIKFKDLNKKDKKKFFKKILRRTKKENKSLDASCVRYLVILKIFSMYIFVNKDGSIEMIEVKHKQITP